MSQRRTILEDLQLGCTPVAIVRIRIGPGMQLNPRALQLSRSLNLRRVGIDKQTGNNPRFGHGSNDIRHSGLLADHIQTTLGGHLLATLRHQTRSVRL